MLETSVGIGLITVGGLSMLAGVLYWLNPFGVFGHSVILMDELPTAPVLSTTVEAPTPMWLRDPDGESPITDEAAEELYAELFQLRSMVGELSRDVRLLKSQVASMSEEAPAAPQLRRVA